MKWIWLCILGLAVPLLILGGAVLALQRPGLPLAAQQSLDDYLAQPGVGGSEVVVQSVARAARPTAFTAQQSTARFGDAYYFDPSGAGRPLPYPPTDLWCVTFRPGGEAATVLVALHEDLYTGSWFVHEVPPATAAVQCP